MTASAFIKLDKAAFYGQDEPSCLIWTRDAIGGFPAEPLTVTGTDEVLEIPASSLAIPLAEIYRGIFAAPQAKD
jgi:hypothetical protein